MSLSFLSLVAIFVALAILRVPIAIALIAAGMGYLILAGQDPGLVAEQIKLAYPMRALCSRGEACRGLCSNCGAALNEVPVSVRVCPSCNCAVPATPVADDSAADAETSNEPPREGSLAAALEKAGLKP